MKGLRIVFVTRRFWPLFGGAENSLAVLATEMRACGARPTILTARWEPDWPSRVFYAGVPVIRMPKPHGQAWGTFRYLHHLRRWLKRHRNEIDLVCVSALRLEAYATLSALRGSSIPVVLRAEQAGAAGDCQWHRGTRFGGRVRQKCRLASAVIATAADIAGELRGADFPMEQIHLIPNGIAIQAPRNPAARLAARQALADANADMKIDPASKVVLFMGRLAESSGLPSLVKAWPIVQRDHPNARLWIIGDGPLRDDLFEEIVDLHLQSSILMPGTFDEVDDLLTVADVMVCPSAESGVSLALLQAALARLPIVAVDASNIRACRATAGENAVLTSPNDPTAMGEAIARTLDCPPPRHALLAACRWVEREMGSEQMLAGHCSLFRRLINHA